MGTDMGPQIHSLHARFFMDFWVDNHVQNVLHWGKLTGQPAKQFRISGQYIVNSVHKAVFQAISSTSMTTSWIKRSVFVMLILMHVDRLVRSSTNMCCSWACVPAYAAGDMPNEVDAPHICVCVSFIISQVRLLSLCIAHRSWGISVPKKPLLAGTQDLTIDLVAGTCQLCSHLSLHLLQTNLPCSSHKFLHNKNQHTLSNLTKHQHSVQ